MPGGAYKPLSEDDIRRIYDTALDLLENIGIGDPIPEILRYALPGGCVLGDDNRLRFPRALIEDLIDVSAKEYICYAPDPRFDKEVGGQKVYFSTAGESVSILEYESQSYRPTTLVDLYDAARLADTLEHIHSFGQPFIAAEYSHDLYVHDMNIAYAELAGHASHSRLELLKSIISNPLLLCSIPTWVKRRVPETAILHHWRLPHCLTAEIWRGQCAGDGQAGRVGLVVDVAVAPQAGATSPAALAGTLVQCFAETLACMAIVNLVRPGLPINFGMWPFISDLRTEHSVAAAARKPWSWRPPFNSATTSDSSPVRPAG